MNSANDHASATCRYVMQCEKGAAWDDGDLTVSHGFLPRRLRTRALPPPYEAWEQTARDLPALSFSPTTRKTIASVPLLPSDPVSLPDRDLKRAAMLLGMLAHSYWRFGVDRMFIARNKDIPDELPESIRRPWDEVCRRLGRSGPGLTIEDWVFNNFTFLDAGHVGADGDYDVANISNETVRPLVPAYGSEVERVFTSSFIDIHAAITPVVGSACRIADAIHQEGPDGCEQVARELEEIARCARAAMTAFSRVSPNRGSRTYCDPVDWAKTLVTWTVPPPGYPPGPSGSATPLNHFMDAVIGRTEYDTTQGVFAKSLRGTQLSRKHEHFCDLVKAVDIRAYITGLRATGGNRFGATAAAFDYVIESFAGANGFLGVHKGKVIDYLGVGTVVGRNQSTAHDQTHIQDSSWTAMADGLADAITERETRRVEQALSGSCTPSVPSAVVR